MSSRVFVPNDSSARSLGADAVAEALATVAADMQIVRNGSRGLYWLEPLLEIESEGRRVGFGPVQATDVPSLFADGLPGPQHPLYLGPVEEIPYLAGQQRITSARIGIIEPLSPASYRDHGGWRGLERARTMDPQAIVDEIKQSGLRGRGGAAFPTGIKWQTVLDAGASGAQKYIVCNADEGDSGTFIDRMIMESDPFCLVEAMVIAGLAVGADRGFIYCRAEYPQALSTLRAAIDISRDSGMLAGFDLQLRKAAGAYICGEETAMLESLEGKRGMVRFRPPLPALAGLFGCPTVVNNVVSLASVPGILTAGADSYASLGRERSRGTLTLQLSGNILRPGLVEVPFGIPLSTVLEDFGGGTASGRPLKAVQAGGPLGAYIHPDQFDTPVDYEAFKSIGAMLGHGGLVVFDDTADLGEMARFAMEFCAAESCGKCTPCRIGAVRGVEVIERIRNGVEPDSNRILLRDLCQTMVDGSLCALGGMAPFPVLSVMDHFGEEL